MKHIFHLGTLVVSTMFLINCGDDAIASERSLAGKGEQLHQGFYLANGSSSFKQSKVLNSLALYQAELTQYANDQPKEVDFDRYHVLLVDMGVKQNGGFSVSINEEASTIKDNIVSVQVSFNHTASHCPVTQAITNPYIFYKVPAAKEVLVYETVTIQDCDQ